MFETMIAQLKSSIDSWKQGPRHRKWDGPTGRETRNEYNGLIDVIDRDPLIFEPRNSPEWTFKYNTRFPANLQSCHAKEAGMSLKWLHPDSHERFEKHKKDTKRFHIENDIHMSKAELLEANGWLEYDVDYKLNEDGFRIDGPDRKSNLKTSHMEQQGGVLYLGCSITFGIGVNIEQTWSHLLHRRLFPSERYLNLGQPGCGVDTYYRILKSYIGILKPQLVICTYPWASGRAEIWDPNQSRWFTHFMSSAIGHMKITFSDGHGNEDAFTRLSQFSPEPSMLRYMKCHDAIKQVCSDNDSKLLWLNVQQMNEINSIIRQTCEVPLWDKGRDLMHHGPKAHEWMSYKIEEDLRNADLI